MGIRQLENYELKKLFNKQGTQLDQINDLIAVALGNTDCRFEMLINPARGDLARGNERAERVFVDAEQLTAVYMEMKRDLRP